MNYENAKEQLKLLRVGEEYSSDPESVHTIDVLDKAIELINLAEQGRSVFETRTEAEARLAELEE